MRSRTQIINRFAGIQAGFLYITASDLGLGPVFSGKVQGQTADLICSHGRPGKRVIGMVEILFTSEMFRHSFRDAFYGTGQFWDS